MCSHRGSAIACLTWRGFHVLKISFVRWKLFAIAVMVVVCARRWVVVDARRSPSVDAFATCMFKDGPVNSPRPSLRAGEKTFGKKLLPLLDLCVSSLRRGHANLLCIVPILTDDPRKESNVHE